MYSIIPEHEYVIIIPKICKQNAHKTTIYKDLNPVFNYSNSLNTLFLLPIQVSFLNNHYFILLYFMQSFLLTKKYQCCFAISPCQITIQPMYSFCYFFLSISHFTFRNKCSKVFTLYQDICFIIISKTFSYCVTLVYCTMLSQKNISKIFFVYFLI